ncbi:hypothetical protein VaNZ11_010174 [Volvox africanus]|uniref:Chloride channel protein n=1 Tax=Volvox africanus TaxID=51714 RepID=A0ABQ5SA73_9CHLO|nr:hypothetical protein VaNZ11_010174 [Volvox africanus]
MPSSGAEALTFSEPREYSRFFDGYDDEDPYVNGAAAANDPLLGGVNRRGGGGSGGDSGGSGGGGGGGGVDDEPDTAISWRRAWRALFKKGNDVESARVNHNFTPEERAKLANVESIDYLAPNSATYRKWLARQPYRRSWDRWVMMGAIGVATGLVAHLLDTMIGLLARFKYGITRWLLQYTNVAVALLFNVTVSVVLVAASSVAVIGWAAEAQGSGVPEVMAYLNGCMLPKLFNVATLVVKFLSCGLVVASGLPVGPEGPLLHIGAAIGAALSQGHSTTLGFNTGMFKRFRNPKDKRDFVTAGVSVGVAAAFNAPIGGLLFAFEEVASFWQQRLGWQVFYACMCATLTLNLSRSAGKALQGKGSFGWFDKEVAFEQIGMSFSSHVLAVVPAAVIGLLAGLVAIAFTIANIKLARLRSMLTGHLKWKRAIEPCILAAVYITGCMLLPLFFDCTSTECVIDERGDMQCNTGLRGPGEGIPTQAPSLPLYTCHMLSPSPPPPPLSPAGPFNVPTAIPYGGSPPDADSATGPQPRLRFLGDSPNSLTPGNTSTTVSYNQLATLLFSTGEEGIKHLLARGTHRRFGYGALITMGVYYFVFAVLVSGSAVSSGLFVPMLMIGAVLGRTCGLATVDVAQALGKRWSVDNFGPWTWIDPGAFALVGAGAFMGGVTRMTVALAVIMIEVSSDVHMLLPVLVAIMVAKWVADAATHSLYHGLLEVKCVPFLSSEPVSALSLDLLPVSYVMRSPVVCLRQRMTVQELSEVLRRCQHNGFPVLRDGPPTPSPASQLPVSSMSGIVGSTGRLHNSTVPGGPLCGRGTCCGLVSRAHLLVLVQKALLLGRTENLDVDWTELNKKMMDPVSAAKSLDAAQQMAVINRELSAASAELNTPELTGARSLMSLLRAAGLRGSSSGGGSTVIAAASTAAHRLTAANGGSEPMAISTPAAAPGASELRFVDATLDYGTFGVMMPYFNDANTDTESPPLPPPVPVPRGPSLQVPAVAAAARSGCGGTLAFAPAAASVSDHVTPGGSSSLVVRARNGEARPGLTFGDDPAAAAAAGGGAVGTSPHVPFEAAAIDLTPYINTSVFMVPDTFSVERTYVLFRTMGLRHLIVVDEQHMVKGIVTRKDLLGYRLDDALGRALNGPSGGGSSQSPQGAGSGRTPTMMASGGAVPAGSRGNGSTLLSRPSATGGSSPSLHPTTAGMRNLLANGDLARPPSQSHQNHNSHSRNIRKQG